jgi:hypothetical protein
LIFSLSMLVGPVRENLHEVAPHLFPGPRVFRTVAYLHSTPRASQLAQFGVPPSHRLLRALQLMQACDMLGPRWVGELLNQIKGAHYRNPGRLGKRCLRGLRGVHDCLKNGSPRVSVYVQRTDTNTSIAVLLGLKVLCDD